MNITKLYRLSGLHYNKRKKELEDLEKIEVIEIIGSDQRAKIIKINYSNPKILVLINLLEELYKDE
ncbi:hypothetical protein DJ531_11950 [Sulfolobus sp. A20-N-F6]|nr:hypothetical protein DJ531_11950 [Sulfolobus sp. A20-N-F6]